MKQVRGGAPPRKMEFMKLLQMMKRAVRSLVAGAALFAAASASYAAPLTPGNDFLFELEPAGGQEYGLVLSLGRSFSDVLGLSASITPPAIVADVAYLFEGEGATPDEFAPPANPAYYFFFGGTLTVAPGEMLPLFAWTLRTPAGGPPLDTFTSGLFIEVATSSNESYQYVGSQTFLIPEPSSWVLLLAGAVVVAGAAARSRAPRAAASN
jgi:hypothetical protein